MTKTKIEIQQNRIARNIKKFHPDNLIVFNMQLKYRELENLKATL